jgi:hypothetical protein
MRRDHLIADWRDRLAAAETEPVGSSPRRAWLVRVRTRLYRFLLSLYGDGAWRADGSGAIPPSQAAVFDATAAEQLTGKPAKDVGKIRSVLKTVANCQDHRPAAGSLTAEEVLAASWFVVVSSASRLDLARCQAYLQKHHIDSRIERYGNELTLEVPAELRYRAMQLIEGQRSALRKPVRPPLPAMPQSIRLFTIVALLLATPLVCCSIIVFLSAFGPTSQPLAEVEHAAVVALICTFAIGVAATLWAAWRTRRLPIAPSREEAP